MLFKPLMSLSDEDLRRVHRRRTWIGFVLLVIALATAVTEARLLLGATVSPSAFAKLLILLAVEAAIAMLISFWMTRPLQERLRRKRLVLRQAMGTFPSGED